jgi:hypothetical protein
MKFFCSTPNPTAVATRELRELDVQMLAYTAELLRIQQHVGYIEKRQLQLKAALDKGFYEAPPRSTAPPTPPRPLV